MSTPADQVQGYVTTRPPKSPRATDFTDMVFQPGIASNSPSRDLKGRFVASNRIRWHKGSAEKIGGWVQQPLVAPNQSPNSSQPTLSLLLHMDGANGSAFFPDSSTYAHVMTATGAAVDTTNPKFSTGSGVFVNGTYLSTPLDSTLDLHHGPSTIEGWFRVAATPASQVMIVFSDWSTFPSPADEYRAYINGVGWSGHGDSFQVQIGYGTVSGALGPSSVSINDAAWHHFAVQSDPVSGNLQVWIDGVPGPIITGYANEAGSNPNPLFYIGADGSSPVQGNWFNGHLDEIRVTRALRYTFNAPFTAPNAPSANPFPIASTTYIGTVRAACDWASLDAQQWIAFATEQKLYLVNNGTLYDITPVRKTSNAVNVFSTVNTTTIVTVTDVDHRANQGDHVTVIGPITVGGITLAGDYPIATVIDPDNYTIIATAATSTVNLAGGSVSLQYDISIGLAKNGELLGYGTGAYGAGTYGTPRAVGTGAPAKMRIWSLSNWGQDLVASYNTGEIYWWQRSNGPNSRAAIIANAPTAVQRLLVNADKEFLIAVGASDVTGNADSMNVRWCSEGNLDDWLPVILPTANTAGGQRLNFGSRMVTALQTQQQNLVWSDTQLYGMQFTGSPDIFGFTPLGKCFIVGPNAAVDVGGVAYMMTFDDFKIYDGTLRTVECDMWDTVFDNFDRSQAEMVYCASYMTRSEVTWFYPAAGTDVMQYVTLNYDMGVWYGGTMPRTCYHDTSPALQGYLENPYGFNGGYLYLHEVGYDENEGAATNAMYYFLQSWDIGQQSDKPMLINSLIPNFQRLRNGCQFSYLSKESPEDAAYHVTGPFIITPDTTRVDERASGTQTAILIEAASVAGSLVMGQDIRLGVWQAQAGPHGKRMAMPSRGSAINTSNP